MNSDARLRSAPQWHAGAWWRWVADLEEALPDPGEVLAACHSFLVDDDCDRPVGVVEDVILDAQLSAPVRLLVAPGPRDQRMSIGIHEVLEVVPGSRRIVVRCRNGHRPPDGA